MLASKNLSVTCALILALGVVGCGDDDTNGGTDSGTATDSGTMTTDGGGGGTDAGEATDGGGGGTDAGETADSGGSSGLIETPATETLATGLGGTIEQAFICENLIFGGGIGFNLQSNSASPCLGGVAYLTFSFDPSGTDYTVFAGEHIPDASSPETTTDVSISSSTSGTVNGDMDEITGIPADTTVTVTTDELTLDFSFTASTVTITNFELR